MDPPPDSDAGRYLEAEEARAVSREIVETAKLTREAARATVKRTRNALQWSWLLRALRERLRR